MNIGEREVPKYLTHTSNKCVSNERSGKGHCEPTSRIQLRFLSCTPCAKDRISERPITFSLRAPRLLRVSTISSNSSNMYACTSIRVCSVYRTPGNTISACTWNSTLKWNAGLRSDYHLSALSDVLLSLKHNARNSVSDRNNTISTYQKVYIPV